MILVTGAVGKTEQTIIQSLAAKGHTVRAPVHRVEQTKAFTACGGHETVVAKVAAGIMSELGHMSPAYELVSPEALTQT